MRQLTMEAAAVRTEGGICALLIGQHDGHAACAL